MRIDCTAVPGSFYFPVSFLIRKLPLLYGPGLYCSEKEEEEEKKKRHLGRDASLRRGSKHRGLGRISIFDITSNYSNTVILYTVVLKFA